VRFHGAILWCSEQDFAAQAEWEPQCQWTNQNHAMKHPTFSLCDFIVLFHKSSHVFAVGFCSRMQRMWLMRRVSFLCFSTNWKKSKLEAMNSILRKATFTLAPALSLSVALFLFPLVVAAAFFCKWAMWWQIPLNSEADRKEQACPAWVDVSMPPH